MMDNLKGRDRGPRDLSKNPYVNEEITAPEVRLIGHDGKQVGVVRLSEAMAMAEEKGLDLVEIVPQAKPPVCKVIDSAKYRYEQTKKEKDARKKQHIVVVKKIRFSSNIDDHDFMTKVATTRRFLEEGNRVKLTLQMRGRQVSRREMAEQVLLRAAEQLADIAKTEGPPLMEGASNISLVLVKKTSK